MIIFNSGIVGKFDAYVYIHQVCKDDNVTYVLGCSEALVCGDAQSVCLARCAWLGVIT